MTDPAWRNKKLQALCDERHPILRRMRLGDELATDRALLRHIHREIDFYEMQEMRPAREHHRGNMRKAKAILRKLKMLTRRADGYVTP